LLGEGADCRSLKDGYDGYDESCSEYKKGFVRRLCFALGDIGWNGGFILLIEETVESSEVLLIYVYSCVRG
jgi:hypothetical protein